MTGILSSAAELYDKNKIVRDFVEVLNENVPIDYTISEQIVSNAFTGERVYLPEGYMTYDKKFGNPNLNVKVFLNYDNTETCRELTYYDFGKPYFLPRISGIYTIEYSITNILGEEEKTVKTKQIVVEDKNEPIIEEPSLPLVAHVGEQIVFPEVESIEYSNGDIYFLPTTVYVNGEVCENRKYTPSQSGSISVYYSSTGKISGQTSTTEIKEISVHDLSHKEGKLFIGILVAVIALGIGYAAITAIPLIINGSATAKASGTQADFNVHFDDFASTGNYISYTEEEDTGDSLVESFDTVKHVSAASGTTDKAADITVASNQTSATVSVDNMTNVGDTVTLTIPVINESADIKASLSAAVENNNEEYFNVVAEPAVETLNANNATTTVTVTVSVVKVPKVADQSATFTVTLTADPVD